ncbi:uncharacterized protein LOC109721110 [Ananas comosus]|uniref:Uncharacterized protein LOC109721110 n=1 Tax=Ananas comosus TaxID=4615 RepID=A0A199V9T7_ANACO|nr:uncharacterized protein LOC109721110 [Ananas comosus]OAY73641.1 hypothetical protein ACMD2_21187 [Ananas comosus]
MRKFLVLESTSAGRSNRLDDMKGDALDLVKEKLAELLHFFQHIWTYLVSKADEVFPPDTRADTFARWTHIGLVYGLPAALALLCLYCCRHCLCSCLCIPYRCLRSLCCCCRRMMRAPGRRGALIPRDVFESDPRGYFINLRAGREHVF